MLTYDSLKEYLKTREIASYYGLIALEKMQGDAVKLYAKDIFGFLNHRGVADAYERYVSRTDGLRILQAEFDRTGNYSAAATRDVRRIDDAQYKLALLLSFVCTNHRFEILQNLVKFLRTHIPAPREALSIGYGTGYELKLAFDEMPGWKFLAYDNSRDSYQYASGLLEYFGYPAECLRSEVFPLEDPDQLRPYRERFGKVILCELLEHLDDPESALRAVRSILHRDGLLFCTMAVNIAQEDHVFLYRSAEEARAQVLVSGFEIVGEILAPIVIRPFMESKRALLFKRGNYICLARPKRG